MKYIILLTLLIFYSCNDLQIVNPNYKVVYNYDTTVDVIQDEYHIPKFKTYIKSKEYELVIPHRVR